MSQTALERLIAAFDDLTDETPDAPPNARLVAEARQEQADLVEALRAFVELNIETDGIGQSWPNLAMAAAKARKLLAR